MESIRPQIFKDVSTRRVDEVAVLEDLLSKFSGESWEREGSSRDGRDFVIVELHLDENLFSCYS